MFPIAFFNLLKRYFIIFLLFIKIMSQTEKRLKHEPSQWQIGKEEIRKTRLANLSETLRSLSSAIGDESHPRSYGLYIPRKHRKYDNDQEQFINSFIKSYIEYKNLEYIPLNEKEAFIVQIQNGVRDHVISQEMHDEMIQAIDLLYRQQSILEHFVYSNLRSAEDNGTSLAVILIEFERANEYFNQVIDKFLDYYKIAPTYCATKDPCTSPCVQDHDECIYPYDQDEYQFYWGTRLDL
jgi:hypothetical protein